MNGRHKPMMLRIDEQCQITIRTPDQVAGIQSDRFPQQTICLPLRIDAIRDPPRPCGSLIASMRRRMPSDRSRAGCLGKKCSSSSTRTTTR